MELILGLTGAGTLIGGAILWAATIFRRSFDAREVLDSTSPDPLAVAMAAEIERIDARLEDFTLALANGIDHVDRAEKRVRSVVTAAKARYERSGYSDPGIDAEEAQLPLVDAGLSPQEEVPPVQPVMESDSPWRTVPGFVESH